MKTAQSKIKALVLVLAISIGLTAMPQRANALLILEAPLIGQPGYYYDPAAVLLCLFILPFCILNDSADIAHVSAQDLLDNGYNQAQINNIEAGQNDVANYMKANNMNSASQMPQAVEAIKGMLNDDYLSFVSVSR